MNSNGQGLEETEVTNTASVSEPAQPEAQSVSTQAETAPPQVDDAPADVPTATVEASSEGADASAPAEGDWLAQDTSDQKGPKRGDIIDGVVTATSPTAVYVDVGAKAEGVIPGRELERMNRETLDLLKPGASIT